MKLYIFKRVLLTLVLFLLIFLLYKGREVLRISKATSIKKALELQDLKDEISDVELKLKELDKFDQNSVISSDYESIARNELGLIKKDEIVIKPR